MDGRRERTWYRFAAPMQYVDEAPASFRSSATRPRAVDLITTAFHEVVSRRRLISYLVRAEIKKQGTDTVLGNIWWILDPLLSMLVYVVVMTFIFQRKTPDFPLFLLAAMIPFKWFTGTISASVTSVTAQGPLIKQIQFPKIVLPLTINGAELVNLGFGLIVLMGLLLIWPFLDGNAPGPHDHLSLMVLWIPVIAAVQFVFQLGLSLMVAAITVFYRDIGNIISHVLRLLFYLAPILWSFDDLGSGRGGELESALGETGSRSCTTTRSPSCWSSTATSSTAWSPSPDGGQTFLPADRPALVQLGHPVHRSLFLCALGALIFKRLEPAFAKVL